MEPWSRREGDNLTSLAELNESSLLESISKRYAAGKIYTDVGDILVAVNPFRQISIYSDEWSRTYAQRSNDLQYLSPHIYVTAGRALTALVHSKKNQVCVISGESGAGKTESTKLIIQQVSALYIITAIVHNLFSQLMKMCRSSQFGNLLQNKIIQVHSGRV